MENKLNFWNKCEEVNTAVFLYWCVGVKVLSYSDQLISSSPLSLLWCHRLTAAHINDHRINGSIITWCGDAEGADVSSSSCPPQHQCVSPCDAVTSPGPWQEYTMRLRCVNRFLSAGSSIVQTHVLSSLSCMLGQIWTVWKSLKGFITGKVSQWDPSPSHYCTDSRWCHRGGGHLCLGQCQKEPEDNRRTGNNHDGPASNTSSTDMK